MQWDSSLYDKNHSFVSQYGCELLKYLPQNKQQKILDLGCGTGDLSYELSKLCQKVVGIDASPQMISLAREKFPNLDFRVCEGLSMTFKDEFDVVFSNAVFHWISNHNLLLENIAKALKSEGILICEFGALGNIESIENAFKLALSRQGFAYTMKLNFPDADSFSKLLKQNHFEIIELSKFDRPTPLENNEEGLRIWLKQFFNSQLDKLPLQIQEKIFEEVEALTKDKLYHNRVWTLDYKRLRVIASLKK